MGTKERIVGLALCVGLVGGCGESGTDPSAEGETDSGTDAGEESGEDGSTSGEPTEEPRGCGDGALELGTAPLRRLTRAQYNNTVRDLLGDDSRPADAFPADDATIGFAVAPSVSSLVAQHYLDAAETLAATAVSNLDGLLPCDPAEGEDACAEAFIVEFVPRAYRRPLEDDERERLVTLYTDAEAQFGFDDAIATVIEFVLQSPNFLYRVELGIPEAGAEDIVALDAYETASRLSYLLWNTMPDEALFDAAADGALGTTEDLEAQTRRMLDDPRAVEAVATFHRQWMSLDTLSTSSKDAAMFPAWSEDVARSMIAETERFAEHVVLETDGDLRTLLTADFGFVNADLAEVYGIEGVEGDSLVMHDMPSGERSGILTQASLMARLAKSNQTDPVHRGVFVRERLLCQTLPAPPPDVDTEPPDPDPNSTTRERFSEHSNNPACSSCHVLIDPIGFGFENYDAMGAFRTQESGTAVDASGELVETEDVDGPFDGAVELGSILAASDEVRTCVSTQWFRYAFRRPESQADACTQEQIHAAFEAADYSIKELMVGLVLSDGFRFKKVND